MLTNYGCCSQIQIVLPMLYRQTTFTRIWLLMLLIDMISANIPFITLFMMQLTIKALEFFKDELNSMPMREFAALRTKCYAFLCIGKVDKNVMQHTRPMEKKTARGVKLKVKDDYLHFTHHLDALCNFQTFVCKQNLISSAAHTVRTVHNRKVGRTAFDRKR